VQDGAGNYGAFLPPSGGERTFDLYWHARLLAGDVLFIDPRGERESNADRPE
jgi:hypothetical protein